MIIIDSGAYSLIPLPTCETISAFFPIKSSLLIPGCLGKPEVTTTTSEPAISA